MLYFKVGQNYTWSCNVQSWHGWDYAFSKMLAVFWDDVNVNTPCNALHQQINAENSLLDLTVLYCFVFK